MVGAALLGVGACPTVAFGTTWSSQQRKTVGGVTYTFMSGIDEGLKPTASTSVAASGNVASRSFAARACLKNQLKAVVASSGWVYNATRSVKAVVSHTRPAGSYFSQGQVILGGRQHDASPSVVCYGAPEKYEFSRHDGWPAARFRRRLSSCVDVRSGRRWQWRVCQVRRL